MTLPFSLNHGNEPTCFPQLILSGLHAKGLLSPDEFMIHMDALYGRLPESYPVDYDLDRLKLHKIRLDPKDRWERGSKIHMVIYNRSKSRYQFAPVLECTGVQTIYMSYAWNDIIEITVGSHELFGYHEKLKLAQNDGFKDWESFFKWFYPHIMKAEDQFLVAKLIHWTDLRY